MPTFTPQAPPQKKRKAWPFVLLGVGVLFILLLVLVVSLALCSPSGPPITPTTSWAGLTPVDHSATLAERYNSDDTWVVYWYLCGSDLETDAGLASRDLQEMMKVKLPSNVSVVIEAGGAREWKNDFDPRQNSRYLYDSTGLHLIETIPRANMGDKTTFENFLSFCNDNYPADHKVLVLWNHGGGSIAGVIFDQQFGYDSLSLADVQEALGAVSNPSQSNPPYEIIGFDACLMATIDTADILRGFANYMVASEEMEPGLGWDYTGWLQALADDTGMGGAMLGKEICDSFYNACKKAGQADEVTLSVVHLGRVDALMDAYHNIGAESLLYACENPSFVSDFGRAASKAQNYGFNNRWDGYTNMVDLGDLVMQSGRDLLPEFGADLLHALDNCVVYQVAGSYRDRSYGLACFYNYSGTVEDYRGFAEMREDNPFRWYYYYELAGRLSEEGLLYVQNLAFIYVPEKTIDPGEIESAEMDDLEDFPLILGDDDVAVLDLGPTITAKLTGVYCYTAYYDEEAGLSILLGRNNDFDSDWERGIFKASFDGTWGCIDGTLVYMELIDEGEGYELYIVPVLLNGEEYSLSVSYSYTSREYEILGARRGIDDNGMADRNLRQLEPGDVIEPLHYVLFDEPNAEFEQLAVESLTVTENTRFYRIDMGDGIFFFMFEMVDVLGNEYLSEGAVYEVINGKISLFRFDEELETEE